MLAIPLPLQKQFEKYLQKSQTPNSLQGHYKKWLQYYLDFCRKYDFSPAHKDSLSQFIRKLNEKKQNKEQQEQAVKAIRIYYKILESSAPPKKEQTPKPARPAEYIPPEDGKVISVSETVARPIQYQNAPKAVHLSSKTISPPEKEGGAKVTGASWQKQYDGLENEIRVRHYSSKTLKSYKGWVQKFQSFTRSKSPELLSTDDVKEIGRAHV